MPGRWACGGLQISIVQSAGSLSASSTARSLIAMAVLIGAAANSSSRDHCTRTVRPGMAHGDEGGIERRIVGGVVAVGAGALAMEHRDLRGSQAERAGEPVAQHGRALGMRPDLERAILEFGERAGWPDRAIGEERPRKGGLDHAALAAAAGCPRCPRCGRARAGCLKPSGLPASVGRRRAARPHAQARGRLRPRASPRFRSSDVKATKSPSRRMSIGALAALRTAVSSSVGRDARRATAARSTRACSTIVRRDVVDEGRRPPPWRQIEPRQMLADDPVGRRPLGRRGAAAAGGQASMSPAIDQ